jgi:hypothetical protein
MYSSLKHWPADPLPFTSTIAKAIVFTQPGVFAWLGPSAGCSNVVKAGPRLALRRPTL